MSYNLHNTTLGYKLSIMDVVATAATGFSGIAYAGRHWEVANKTGLMGHRVIALIEFFPLIGGVAAIVEWVVANFFYPPTPVYKPIPETDSDPLRTIKVLPPSRPPTSSPLPIPLPSEPRQPVDSDFWKMCKNARKAEKEHLKRPAEEVTPGEVDALYQELKTHKPAAPLTFSYTDAESIGFRSAMEDAHFITVTPEGVLAGVFDGHGGEVVAELANERFQELFFPALKSCEGNIRLAFKRVFHAIQTEIVSKAKAANDTWGVLGCTAVVCWADANTGLVYTATLGDSEAYICVDGKAHPCSTVRNWGSEKDAKRASEVLGDPRIAKNWPKITQPKTLRFTWTDPDDPGFEADINVSRALGDLQVPAGAMSQNPKITVNRIQRGQVLVLACDGLPDYVEPEKMAAVVKPLESDTHANIARNLLNASLEAQRAIRTRLRQFTGDNVSVIAIRVG